jgi:hypothetical protein
MGNLCIYLVLSVREGVSMSVLLHCHQGGSQLTSQIRGSVSQEGESISDVVTPSDRGEGVCQSVIKTVRQSESYSVSR